MIEGIGSDQLDGGAGTDTMDFRGSTQVEIASMVAGIATVNGTASTTFTSIENVNGSPGDDHIVGDGNPNVLAGGDGNDVIEGAAGDDVLTGGQGSDTVDFVGATQGVVVDLAAGTAVGDGADTFSEFENASGSAYADTITGDETANAIAAGDGDDIVDGGLGDDQLMGGAGSTCSISGRSVDGVQVDLQAGTAAGDGADTVAEFENVKGSALDDDIMGDDGPTRSAPAVATTRSTDERAPTSNAAVMARMPSSAATTMTCSEAEPVRMRSWAAVAMTTVRADPTPTRGSIASRRGPTAQAERLNQVPPGPA